MWHLTAAVVGAALLLLVVTDKLVWRSRLRRNLPLLTGWIVVGKFAQIAGSMWLVGYFTWVFLSR